MAKKQSDAPLGKGIRKGFKNKTRHRRRKNRKLNKKQRATINEYEKRLQEFKKSLQKIKIELKSILSIIELQQQMNLFSGVNVLKALYKPD